MDRETQNVFLSKWYGEANRYMDNAKEALKKADKRDDGHYRDTKYVETACGVAYIGVLRALDAWFAVKDVPVPGRKKHKNIEFYMSNATKIDNKLVAHINTAYNVLHLAGYYRGETSVDTIASGFKAAHEIIEKIKPGHFVPHKEGNGQKVKRLLNNLMVSFAVMFR